MPSPTRNTKEVWLLVSRRGETERALCVTAQFKHAYALALFEHRVSEPNLSERRARELARQGPLWLWNRQEFDSFEEAMWSPVGHCCRLEKIPVKKA